MHQPCLDIGPRTMSTMLDRLENSDLPTRDISLSCNLVIRNRAAADPILKSALVAFLHGMQLRENLESSVSSYPFNRVERSTSRCE